MFTLVNSSLLFPEDTLNKLAKVFSLGEILYKLIASSTSIKLALYFSFIFLKNINLF